MICEWGPPGTLARASAQAAATQVIGAKYAKWQAFNPDSLVSGEAQRYWAPELGGPDSQRALFAAAGMLEPVEWADLFVRCREIGVEPMVSAFDPQMVGMLANAGLGAFKIASGDITYRDLVLRIAATQKPVFLSTGAANYGEIARAEGWLNGCATTLMACDLVYPCRLEDSNIGSQIEDLRDLHVSRIGYSDHTREEETGAVAVALGATVLEKHVTLNPDGDAPDDKMALTVRGARRYREMADAAARILASVDGDPQQPARVGARRSAHARTPLPEGHVLSSADIAWLRPCPAGAVGAATDLSGRKLTRAVEPGERIGYGDLD